MLPLNAQGCGTFLLVTGLSMTCGGPILLVVSLTSPYAQVGPLQIIGFILMTIVGIAELVLVYTVAKASRN